MLQSVLVYLLLALALFALGWHISKREDKLLKNSETKLPFYSWEIITSVLIFAAILGIRWHTGYDHEMYLYEYSRLQNGLDCTREFEPGFLLIGKVFAKLGIHYSIYFAFWADLQIGGVYFALRDRKYLLPWVGILIVTGPYMLNWVNSMRQATVACLFLAAMPLIINKRFWLYALFVLLCATIHKSALLLLPVYFVPWIKPGKLFKGRYAHYAILGCCILLGLYPIWITAIGQFLDSLSIVGYEKYEALLQPIVEGGWRYTNWGPSRIGLLILNLSIIWFYPQLKRFYSGDSHIRPYYMMAFIGMCYSNLMMNTSHFLLRPGEYFLVFVLVILAYLLNYLYKTRQHVVFVALSLIAMTHIFVEVYKAVYQPTRENIPVLYNFFYAQ